MASDVKKAQKKKGIWDMGTEQNKKTINVKKAPILCVGVFHRR